MPPFLKNFLDWFNLKPKLDNKNHKPPMVKEGTIWWIYTGENIGTEISGKGENFTRPAIIYKKLSHYTFLIIPTSTKIKTGSWYVPLYFEKVNMVACLHQIKVIDYRRIDKLMYDIPEPDFEKIQNGFLYLYTHKIYPLNKLGGRG